MGTHSSAGSGAEERARLRGETRRWLLAQARRAMAAALDGCGDEPPPDGVPAGAEEPRGCFVTLHTATGQLRGCIGTFESNAPLWLSVREMAVAAALRDPRFAPVTLEELSDCVVEISALTPPAPARAEEVEVGRHGVCVRRGMFRGVLLPQVATEYGWDREMFLDYTCRKAGLPPSAWRDGSVEIETFTAEVFSEQEQTRS